MSKNLFGNLSAIAIGGAFGAFLRYIINLQTITIPFPIGTLLENLIGSFLLGMLTGWIVHFKMKEMVKLGIGVGFCGGFTTMSTLAADTYSLFLDEQWLIVISYLSFSVFGGVSLAFVGYIVGENRSANYRSKRNAGEL